MRAPGEFDGWTVVQYRQEIKRLRREIATLEKEAKTRRDGRDDLSDVLSQVGKAIKAEDVQAMVKKILTSERPNPLALRELARLGGWDVSEKPKITSGPGATLIVIRPHRKLLEGDPVAQLSIQRQIEQLEAADRGE